MNRYYASGEALKAKNKLAGGAALDVPEFALSMLELDRFSTALDVGCGWGRFAVPLIERAPELRHLVCSDLWPGMVATCRTTLGETDVTADFVAADVRGLPFCDRSADLVMANHMLYEIPDVDVAIAELARVLRRDGQLLATTYSDARPVPLTALHFATVNELGFGYPVPEPSTFCLENGRDLLLLGFAEVECEVLEETTVVTDPDSLLSFYLLTGGYDWASSDETIPENTRSEIPTTFRRLAAEQIEREGAITTVTSWTAFIARSPR